MRKAPHMPMKDGKPDWDLWRKDFSQYSIQPANLSGVRERVEKVDQFTTVLFNRVAPSDIIVNHEGHEMPQYGKTLTGDQMGVPEIINWSPVTKTIRGMYCRIRYNVSPEFDRYECKAMACDDNRIVDLVNKLTNGTAESLEKDVEKTEAKKKKERSEELGERIHTRNEEIARVATSALNAARAQRVTTMQGLPPGLGNPRRRRSFSIHGD